MKKRRRKAARVQRGRERVRGTRTPRRRRESERNTDTQTEVRAEAPPPTAGRFSGGTGSAGGTDQTYTHARLFVEHGGQGTDPLNFTTGVGVGVGWGWGVLGMRGRVAPPG